MTRKDALDLERKIEDLCEKHGLWLTIEHEKKPDLKMVRIKEISIKIDK